VVRRTKQGLELILGKRRRERDGVTWSLPKGTPDGAETIEETALREVSEESGLEVKILAPVGPIEYYFVQSGQRIHKTVHYFLMAPTGGDLVLHDHEFDEVRWFGAAEAEAIMSFPTERDIMLQALALPEAA
jgi:8-oxo-dGTP pyrophosphatase MutT (NUDIX family)